MNQLLSIGVWPVLLWSISVDSTQLLLMVRGDDGVMTMMVTKMNEASVSLSWLEHTAACYGGDAGNFILISVGSAFAEILPTF